MFREDTPTSSAAPTRSLTHEEFARIYDQCREGAIKRAMAACRVAREVAEDAVQNAAIYCLENLGRFQELTPSYFYQLAINNARMISRSEGARGANREHGVGDWLDLANVEEDESGKRSRRVPPVPRSE